MFFGLASGKVGISPLDLICSNSILKRQIHIGFSHSILILTIADIVKMVESEPDLASRIRRVRGGYLKIQGTWMPYEV
jgi:hypothetical protein